MRTDGQVEFVKFDEKMFDEIEKEMREGETKSLQQAVVFSMLIFLFSCFNFSGRNVII